MRIVIRVILLAVVLFPIIMIFAPGFSYPSLTPEEMRFVQAFKKDTVIVYKSAKGQIDTIKFLKAKMDTAKYRNIEQGFYNEISLFVSYATTNNSFHKNPIRSITKGPDYFLLFLKRKSSSHPHREIGFLGLLFDEDYINKILNTKDNQIVFNGENILYTEQNINKGIKSFTFDFEKGVISYIDDDSVKWVRSK